MEIDCLKCGFKGDGHTIGRYRIPYVIIQCPECCFIFDLVTQKELTEKACSLQSNNMNRFLLKKEKKQQ